MVADNEYEKHVYHCKILDYIKGMLQVLPMFSVLLYGYAHTDIPYVTYVIRVTYFCHGDYLMVNCKCSNPIVIYVYTFL